MADPVGRRTGGLELRFKRSLLRATWAILDAELIPLVGPFWALVPVPYHFTLKVVERAIGRLSRVMSGGREAPAGRARRP